MTRWTTTAPSRPQGGDGRADALSRLHQPVPDAAAPGRRPPLSARSTRMTDAPASCRGVFFWRSGAIMLAPCPPSSIRPATRRRHSRHHAHLCAGGRARHGVVRARAARRSRDDATDAGAARRRLSLSGGRDRRRARGLRLCRALSAAAGLSLHRRGFDLRRARAAPPRHRPRAARAPDRRVRAPRLPADDRGDRRFGADGLDRAASRGGLPHDRRVRERRLQVRPLARHRADAARARAGRSTKP